jgi:threonine/homoserine/homoserine lactone efflux protein
MLYGLVAFVVLLIVLAVLHVISERVAAIVFLLLSCGVVYFAWISPNLRHRSKNNQGR